MAENDALHGSLLEHPELLPLCPAEDVLGWGRTLVVAPHPDDETLACGGTLALLARARVPIRILCVTDGTLSHPNSATYPAPRLKKLREQELQSALMALGIGPDNVQFLRYRDRHTPFTGDAAFFDAIAHVAEFLAAWPPQTVLLPWRRDPHPDHRASSALVLQALLHTGQSPRLLEWPLWAWAIAESDDAPRPEEASAFRVDIGTVLDLKRRAIDCHASQVTGLIDDDPQGFRLTPDVLLHFLVPYEVFLEGRP